MDVFTAAADQPGNNLDPHVARTVGRFYP